MRQFFLFSLVLLTARAAFADDAPPPGQQDKPPEGTAPASNLPVVQQPAEPPVVSQPVEAPKPKPPPYSIPWQLRPVVVPNVVRWDNTFAFYEDVASRKGFSYVTILNGIVRIPKTGGPGAGLGAFVRVPIVYDTPPGGTPSGAAFTNPLVAAVYGAPMPKPLRLSGVIGLTIPMGMGGGDMPDAGQKNARVKAIPARGHIDSALFNVNDFGLLFGANFAYVDYNFTAQIDANLAQFFRVRGDLDQPEKTKTSFISGIHVGYFVIPQLSVGADLRYQRWLDAPIAVEKDKTMDSYDNTTMTIGVRGHIPLGSFWLRPGVAYARALDKPMAAATPNYHMIQVDVPFFF